MPKMEAIQLLVTSGKSTLGETEDNLTVKNVIPLRHWRGNVTVLS